MTAMKSPRMNLIHRVYREPIYYTRPGQVGIYIPVSRSMRRYYRYRGRPLAHNGSR